MKLPDASSFARPESTHSAVLAELRSWLASGSIAPGSRLVVDQISAKLQVSPVPVREALRILEGEGQVTYVHHQGYRVVELSLQDLGEIYRMRELLEADAIRFACESLDDETLARIGFHLAETTRFSRRENLAGYGAANRRFHFEIFRASGRPILVRTIIQLWDRSEAYRAMFANKPEHLRTAEAQHNEIMAAVRARDAERAIAAQDAHRNSAHRALRDLLAS